MKKEKLEEQKEADFKKKKVSAVSLTVWSLIFL